VLAVAVPTGVVVAALTAVLANATAELEPMASPIEAAAVASAPEKQRSTRYALDFHFTPFLRSSFLQAGVDQTSQNNVGPYS
jgi:hypothetical protein